MQTFYLRVRLEGSENWQEVEIHDLLIIGRNEELCDFVIADRLASRKHARIVVRDGLVYLEDLGSSNGTKILGQPIVPNLPRQITEGDYFSIGHALCQVVSSREENPYRLWYRIENQPWQEINFTEDVVLGRGDDVDLQINEGHISRNHALLKVASDNFYLQDLGSQNGTFLEGQRLPANQPFQIYPGQYFSVGRATLTVAEEKKQVAFHQTVADIASDPSIHISLPQQAQGAGRPMAMQPQKKKSALPWLIGLGGLLMVCVCVVVVGGLYFINQIPSLPVDDLSDLAEYAADNEEQIGEILDEGLDAISEAEDILPTDGDVLPESGDDLVDTVTDLAGNLTGDEQTSDEPELSRKWLVMMYQDADDETLEYDIVFDVNTAEAVGSTEEVAVVVQLDRYDGAYSGDGDWTGSRRYYLSPDGDLDIVQSPVAADLGEVDSGDVNTLVDFAIWAMQSYPAENYILIMSDHGAGWFGGFTDGDNYNEDGIYLPALESALQYITSQTGEKLDILGFDACLMAELEVWAAVAPYANIGVGSEESESATGWAYAAFLNRLIKNPAINPEELSRAIVETFVDDDMAYELLDTDPRYVMDDSTLSAIRLDAVSAVSASLDGLVAALQYVDQGLVAEARTYTRSYIAFSDSEPFLLDLVHFSQMVCVTTNDTGICTAAESVEQAVSNAIINEKHGGNMDGSNGLTFYFPDSDFFEITKDNSYGYAYRAHAIRFTEISSWDEFLEYHYEITEGMP